MSKLVVSIELDDGVRFRVVAHVLDVIRSDTEKDQHGKPVYHIEPALAPKAVFPDSHLKGKV